MAAAFGCHFGAGRRLELAAALEGVEGWRRATVEGLEAVGGFHGGGGGGFHGVAEWVAAPPSVAAGWGGGIGGGGFARGGWQRLGKQRFAAPHGR